MSGDVVIVGGGAIGVSCALELARAGAQVTLLEAASTLDVGCSSGNAGLLCPSHATPLASRAALRQGIRWSLSKTSPFALRLRPALLPWLARFLAATGVEREERSTRLLRELSIASLALHRELGAQIGTGIVASGTLNVYETEAGFAQAQTEAAGHTAAGMRAELLDPRTSCEAEPALIAPVAGSVFYPEELSCDPAQFVHTVAAAAEAAGALIRLRTEVLSLRAAHGRVVGLETTAGPLSADTVVLAAGVWTAGLARTLGLRVPLQGGKGYHLDYAAADGDPRAPTFLREAHVVITPLPGRLRLAGTLELGGIDSSINRARLEGIEQAALRRIRGLPGRQRLELWRGLRPCSPDGLPIIGRPAAYDNLLVATGHAMLGFTLAPLTAQLIAALAAGGEAPAELLPLHPDRFRGLGGLLPGGAGTPGRR